MPTFLPSRLLLFSFYLNLLLAWDNNANFVAVNEGSKENSMKRIYFIDDNSKAYYVTSCSPCESALNICEGENAAMDMTHYDFMDFERQPKPFNCSLSAPILWRNNPQVNIPPFVFMHIPKTGGTTYTSVIEKILNMFCTKSKYPFELNEIVDPNKCLWVHLWAGPLENHRISYASSNITRAKFAIGHLHFGYCVFIWHGCRYFTMLREPVSRFLSHYFYVLRESPSVITRFCQNCTTLGKLVYRLHITLN